MQPIPRHGGWRRIPGECNRIGYRCDQRVNQREVDSQRFRRNYLRDFVRVIAWSASNEGQRQQRD